MSTTSNHGEARKLPLWHNCLEVMRKDGVACGSTYQTAWFEDQLSCKRERQFFRRSISKIRDELLDDGLYLSGEGQDGNQFVVLQYECNADQGLRWQDAMMRMSDRTIRLLSNTPMDHLTEDQRWKTKAVLERAQTRHVLLSKTKPLPIRSASEERAQAVKNERSSHFFSALNAGNSIKK